MQDGSDDGGDETDDEEDWSDLIGSGPSDGGFARHDHVYEFALRTVACPAAAAATPIDDTDDGVSDVITVAIASISALSPIDMVHLCNGTQDVTGHRIWPGALLFVSALPSLAGRLLQNRRVLELGTGTGLAGIAIDRSCRVQCLVLTDASDSALDLCRRNCATNRVSDRVAVEKLVWGELDGPSGERSARGEGAGGPVEPPPAFDTVVATDVVYDLDSWKPLLDTVSRRLREGGTMILSHVPRAALPSYSPREKRKTIEEIIVEQARCYDLHLGETIYPAELLSVATKDGSGANKMDLCLRELQETGASILLFQKQTGCSSPCPFDRVSDR